MAPTMEAKTTSAPADVKSVTWEATVIRADGTVEDLGVIAAWHRNPLIRLWHALRGRGRVDFGG